MNNALSAAVSLFERFFARRARGKPRGGADEEEGGKDGGDAGQDTGADDFDVMRLVKKFIIAIVVIIIIYLVVALYYRNLWHYPPLLATPIRGDTFDTYPNEFPYKKPHPVVDRSDSTDGINLPYTKNALAFLPDRVIMPIPNPKNRHSVALWIKAENLADNHTQDARYAYLLAMHYRVANAGDSDDPTNLAIMYNGHQNELVVRVKIRSQLGEMQEFHVPNVLKIQTWQMITVVLDNRNLDIYIDDVLHRSFFLANVPMIETNMWSLFPGEVPFRGTLTCVRYFDYALNHHEIKRIHARTKSKDIPSMSFLRWWTWTRSNAFTRLFYS